MYLIVIIDWVFCVPGSCGRGSRRGSDPACSSVPARLNPGPRYWQPPPVQNPKTSSFSFSTVQQMEHPMAVKLCITLFCSLFYCWRCLVVCCQIPSAQCRCPWRRAGPPWRACDWGAAEQRTPQGDARQGWSGCCPTRHCRRPTVPLLQPPSPTGCLSLGKPDTANIKSTALHLLLLTWQDMLVPTSRGLLKMSYRSVTN